MKQDKLPSVSVLVPVYNAANHLAATINAVLAQTYGDFELILLDDASSDNSAQIISQFDDKRIIYAKNEQNLGISATRNKLISMAQGEFIAVLDNDDICLPNRLETQVNFLRENPEIAIVGSWFELFAPTSAPWWRRLMVNLGWIWRQPLRPTIDEARCGNVLMHPTAMYRRELFAKHNISYREKFSPAEDYDLIYQALSCGLKLANIPKILLKYNLHGNNFSIVQKEKMRRADLMVKEEIQKTFPVKKMRHYPRLLTILQKLRLKFMIGDDNV